MAKRANELTMINKTYPYKMKRYNLTSIALIVELATNIGEHTIPNATNSNATQIDSN